MDQGFPGRTQRSVLPQGFPCNPATCCIALHCILFCCLEQSISLYYATIAEPGPAPVTVPQSLQESGLIRSRLD